MQVQPEYSDHARRRMAQRGISERAIQHVIEEYDVRTNRADGCTEYTGAWQGRRIKVVANETANPKRIVTVHDMDDA